MAHKRNEQEDERVEALERLGILDTEPEARFDRLVELAAQILDVPIALVSLIDRDRQWFKARVGLDVEQTPVSLSICAHAIEEGSGALFVVEDTETDERFAQSPLVTGDPNIRFYAGCVVSDPLGVPVGTICAVDREPRVLSDAQQAALRHLAVMVEHELARADELDRLAAAAETEFRKSLMLETMTEGVVLQDTAGKFVEWNAAAERILGVSREDLVGLKAGDARWETFKVDGSVMPPDARPPVRVLKTAEPMTGALMGMRTVVEDRPGDAEPGELSWLSINARPIFDDDGNLTHVLSIFDDITVSFNEKAQRRGIEERLERAERLAEVSLDALDQGVVLVDPSGEISRMNPAAYKTLGYNADEASERFAKEMWSITNEFGEPLKPHERPIAVARATGLPVSDSIIGIERKDGVRVALRLSCIPNADGRGSYLIAFTDVTERRRAQQILDATFDTAPVGLALTDPDGDIVRCNPSFAEQAGRSSSELIGVSLADVIEPGHGELAARHSSASDGEERSLERKVSRPDGGETWVLNYSAEINRINPPVKISATVDVTRERALLTELARYGRLFHYAEDLIIVVDADGLVLFASPSGERLATACGGDTSDFFAMIHSHDRIAMAIQLESLREGAKQTGSFTFRIQDRQGESQYLECVAANLLDDPVVHGIVLTARDVTDRHLLARQLEHQARHDSLTGLGNRRLLDESLSAALTRCNENGSRVGACYIDLDGFKAINDRLGHAVGDDLLRRVADVIKRNTRRSDVSVRMGGDEFVIIMNGVGTGDEMIEVAHRIRDAIVALDFDGVEIGASFGLAISVAGDSPQAILHRADASLYRAKRVRRSQIDVADVAESSAAPLQ